MPLRLCLLALSLLLAACDVASIPGLGPDPRAVQRDADSKAIGGACRYGLRGIEDCYGMNPKASKSQIFAGWKDMDQYMRENKIDGVTSTVPAAVAEENAGPAPAEKSAKAKPASAPH
ncbi:MAG: hypothetical protein WCH44_10260 [Betaproteobacteria bacterium]